MALDLTLLNTTQLDKFLHVQSIRAAQDIAAAKVRALRDYYDGDHPVYLSDRQQQFIGKLMSEGEFEFSHNTIKSVVDTLRERLNVSGFTVNGAGLDGDTVSSETQLAALFWSWWEENRFDAQQIRLHRRTLRDGLSYVMVDYDDVAQRPRFTLHSVDDGTTGIVMHRDPENPERFLFGNKHWHTFNPLETGKTGDERKTTYLPHEIRKYIRATGQFDWQQYSDSEDMTWPLSWRDARGEPLGIPIIEFENPGGSEVAQIIGLQDALNKSWLDLIAAADMAGFPILAIEDAAPESFAEATAAAQEEDDDDDVYANLKFSPGRFLDLKGAKAHRIEAADMSQLISVIHLIIETIAGISRTPSYYLTPMGGTDNVSGETLKMLESGLVKRAEERQLIFGQAWADCMNLSYRIQKTFGPGQLPDIPKLNVQTTWSSAQSRNEKSEAEMGEIYKRLGIPDEMLFARLGFSPQEVQKIMAMRRSDQAATVANIVSAMKPQPTSQPTQSAPVLARVNGNGVVTP